MRSRVVVIMLWCGLSCPVVAQAADGDGPDYNTRVAPILNKYCVGCHNEDDREGGLSLESFADIQRGGERGPTILPGVGESSRLVRVLTGQAKPAMPPEDSQRPSEAEIALLRGWINAGARGPEGKAPTRRSLITPHLPPAAGDVRPIASLAASPDGNILAVARFGEAQLIRSVDQQIVHKLPDHPGKINMISFTRGGSHLLTASGVVGLYGQARIWNVADGSLVKTITGHRDTLYAAVPSADGKLLATAGYDRKIVLWSWDSGEQIRTLEGHNDAIYDLAFSPDGSVLASASGDETIKLWHVASGDRLDTLGQPGEEQFAVAFHPDGKHLLGGGADNRIRVWRFISRESRRINPLVHSRFAHEGAIVCLVFSADGKWLASSSEDRVVKLWESTTYTEVRTWEGQSDVPAALAFGEEGKTLVVGRMDGSLETYPIEPVTVAQKTPPGIEEPTQELTQEPVEVGELSRTSEKEPNDVPDVANELMAPGIIEGRIFADHDQHRPDADLFRFASRAGQQWIVEINAARHKSPLDSKVEILDVRGAPVPRVLLQAVRDSYLTLRGVNFTENSLRIQNWEEMEINEMLYVEGEVVKLFRAPRGPDSGFNVYANENKHRYSYFDTTATLHALHSPCYIVRPHLPGSRIIPTGLPVFPVYYENDDDARRQLGTDSRLSFTAPADSEYLVRISDVRDIGGEKYEYQLTVRHRRPDFQVRLTEQDPKVPAGSGKSFSVVADRIDGFDGEIQVELSGLPPGFSVTTPLVIQAGHDRATGAIYAAADAVAPTEEDGQNFQVSATAVVGGRTVTRPVDQFGKIQLADPPNMLVRVTPEQLVIKPGTTITATLHVERRGHDGRVVFDAENLPHGVIVDNIGLSGIVIPERETERTLYLSADRWVPETSRTFTLKSREAGNQVSPVVLLHVRRSGDLSAAP